MYKILCPTDFSKAGNNGAEYAARFSKRIGAELTIMHAQPVISTSQDTPTFATSNSSDQESMDVQKHLQDYCDTISREFSIHCQYDIQPFSLEKAISEHLGESQYDLIIMGTNGSEDIRQLFYGSKSYHVAKKRECPILIVPDTYAFKDINNIVYASDYSQNDKLRLGQLKKMTTSFNSQISLLHVSKEDTMVSQELNRAFCNLTEEEFGSGQNFECQRVINKDTIEGVESYVQDTKPDLLVLSMKQHNFLYELFHRNLIMEITSNPTCPVLVFHT